MKASISSSGAIAIEGGGGGILIRGDTVAGVIALPTRGGGSCEGICGRGS